MGLHHEVYPEQKARFSATLRMISKGFRMTGGERFAMTKSSTSSAGSSL